MTLILVLEDDPSISLIIASVLADEGYEVATATSIEEAQHLIDLRSPDAMIMDIMIGGEDQRNAYHDFRERGLTAPILLSSALSSVSAIAAELGTSYLSKPFDIDDLAQAVDGLIHTPPAS